MPIDMAPMAWTAISTDTQSILLSPIRPTTSPSPRPRARSAKAMSRTRPLKPAQDNSRQMPKSFPAARPRSDSYRHYISAAWLWYYRSLDQDIPAPCRTDPTFRFATKSWRHLHRSTFEKLDMFPVQRRAFVALRVGFITRLFTENANPGPEDGQQRLRQLTRQSARQGME